MSATSKLASFPVTSEDGGGLAGAQPNADRRRYLMRYVVIALALSGLICMAAGIRVAEASYASAREARRPAPVEPRSEAAGASEPPSDSASPVADSPAPSLGQVTTVSAPRHAIPVQALPAGRAQRPGAAAAWKAHSSRILRSAPF
jgi:hypothetical protein